MDIINSVTGKLNINLRDMDNPKNVSLLISALENMIKNISEIV